MSLRTKVLLCAVTNLVLLAGGFFVFARLQFESGLESLLLAPGQARLRDLGDEVAQRLRSSSTEEHKAILADYSARHHVDLVVTSPTGEFVVGFAALPRSIQQALQPVENPFDPAGKEPAFDRKDKDKEKEKDKDKKGKGKDKDKDKKGKDKGKGRGPERDPYTGRQVFFLPALDPPNYWFGVRFPLSSVDETEAEPAVLMVRAASIFGTPLLFDAKPWIGWVAVALALSALCWFPFVHNLTSTIRSLNAGAERMAQGQFDTPVAEHRADELGHLGASLNRMAAQLRGFVYGQKRFLSDIAHELSAPIARAQVALGILEAQTEGKQQGYALGAQEEVAHMSALVGELLNFSRAGLAADQKSATSIEVATIVQKAIDRERGDKSVTLQGGGELRVMAHEENLLRALSNLIRNAVRYAGDAGPIHVDARRDGADVLISVSDSGPGLPADALDRVFTPFFRLDESRTQQTGGTGLGLAIVKTCVESSGGSVSCRNREPRGLEVTLRLPEARRVA